MSFEQVVEPQSMTLPRDPERYLETIWQRHFADITQVNPITIGYGKPWKCRLGYIRLLGGNRRVSLIEVNALLQVPEVPECVLITTIAHELTHYAHGFCSLHPQRYKYPHANHVVDRELEQRGLGETWCQCMEWTNDHWFSFYESQRASGWKGLPVNLQKKGRKNGTED